MLQGLTGRRPLTLSEQVRFILGGVNSGADLPQ